MTKIKRNLAALKIADLIFTKMKNWAKTLNSYPVLIKPVIR